MKKVKFKLIFLIFFLFLPFLLFAQFHRTKECCPVKRKYKCDDFPTCCVYPPGTSNAGQSKTAVLSDKLHGICSPEAFVAGNTNPVWIGKPAGLCQGGGDWDADGNIDKTAAGDPIEQVPEINAVSEWGLICLFETIFNITDFVAYLLFAIVVIMGIISGILFMTAGGDPGKVETARKLLIYLIVGLVVAVMAKMIPSIVLTVIA